MDFQKEKRDFLKKEDKSKKGEIDAKIKPLLKLVNLHHDYCTTSSCSGRILLYSPGAKKHKTRLHFITHDKANIGKIKTEINKIKQKEIWLKQESFILHVCCKSLESAQKLLDIANKIGLRRSGIISTRRKIMVEIICSEHFDTILAKDGELLVDLTAILGEANKRLGKNDKKLKGFYGAFREMVFHR